MLDKKKFGPSVDCCIWNGDDKPLSPENAPAPPKEELRVWLKEPGVDSTSMGAEKAVGADRICGAIAGGPKSNAAEAVKCIEGGVV
jgi:hypothetical protein